MDKVKKRKKILIADDDYSILEPTSLLLELYGYDVFTTSNGDIARKVKKKHPDIVLLDIFMSGIDGRDVCREIKKDPEMQTTPVILVSASPEVAESTKSCGADDYLAKPFDVDDLIDKVEQY